MSHLLLPREVEWEILRFFCKRAEKRWGPFNEIRGLCCLKWCEKLQRNVAADDVKVVKELLGEKEVGMDDFFPHLPVSSVQKLRLWRLRYKDSKSIILQHKPQMLPKFAVAFQEPGSRVTHSHQHLFVVWKQHMGYLCHKATLSTSSFTPNGDVISTLAFVLYCTRAYNPFLLFLQQTLRLKVRVFVKGDSALTSPRYAMLLQHCLVLLSIRSTNHTGKKTMFLDSNVWFIGITCVSAYLWKHFSRPPLITTFVVLPLYFWR